MLSLNGQKVETEITKELHKRGKRLVVDNKKSKHRVCELSYRLKIIEKYQVMDNKVVSFFF